MTETLPFVAFDLKIVLSKETLLNRLNPCIRSKSLKLRCPAQLVD